jgi:uncharacterized protein YdbL (DUF1318 family)
MGNRIVPTSRFLSILCGLPLLAACVTINVYFPAVAAEKAADRIIEDVWGPNARDNGAPENGSSTNGSDDGEGAQSRAPANASPGAVAAAHVLQWLVPAAHAAEPNIDINTPAIKRITRSMEQRHGQLKPYYESGAIGLTDDAQVAVRDLNSVALPKRSQLKQLVAAENEDRNALYREIAKANDRPEWESDIRDVFAKRWIEKAPAGWFYQTDSGDWTQK